MDLGRAASECTYYVTVVYVFPTQRIGGINFVPPNTSVVLLQVSESFYRILFHELQLCCFLCDGHCRNVY